MYKYYSNIYKLNMYKYYSNIYKLNMYKYLQSINIKVIFIISNK